MASHVSTRNDTKIVKCQVPKMCNVTSATSSSIHSDWSIIKRRVRRIWNDGNRRRGGEGDYVVMYAEENNIRYITTKSQQLSTVRIHST